MSMTYAEALQTTLAGEHAASTSTAPWAPRPRSPARPTLFAALTDAYDAHRARRDQLVAILTDLGEQPVAAEPVYELPKNLDTTDAVTARALEIERSCASTYAYLVANSPAPERRLAVNLLIQTAVRELAFRGTPETLPGSDEYADR